MPIKIYCSVCRSHSNVGAAVCRKCGQPFGKRKRYIVRVYKGKQCISQMCGNLALAREFELELKNQSRLKTFGLEKNQDISLSDLCALRLDALAIDRTPRYVAENSVLFLRLTERWGRQTSLRQITADMAAAYIRSRGRTRAAAYDLSMLKALFAFAIQKGFLDVSPCAGLRAIKTDRQKKYIPPARHIEKVLAISTPEQRTYLLAIKYTLGRIGEINSLRWEDVDFERKSLTLWTRKKRGGIRAPRHIPLLDDLAAALLPLRRPSGYVFVNPRTKTKYDYRKQLLKNLCRRAAVPHFSFHALRHYGASTLASRGAPLSDIQALLGHENITTTSIYIQSLSASARESMELLRDS